MFMGRCWDEITALHLTQTQAYCLPSLMYRCGAWSLRTDEVKRAVAWNNPFRKIFNAYWYPCSIVAHVYLSLLCCLDKNVVLEENVM